MADLVRCCFDDTGVLAMVFVLDREQQLLDPAFNPEHLTCVQISKDAYQACNSVLGVMTAALPALQVADADLAALAQGQIAALLAAQTPPPPSTVTTSGAAASPPASVTNSGTVSP